MDIETQMERYFIGEIKDLLKDAIDVRGMLDPPIQALRESGSSPDAARKQVVTMLSKVLVRIGEELLKRELKEGN